MTLKLVSQESQEINLRGTMTEDDMAKLRKRNEERAAAAKAKLGRSWLCHPANRVPKTERTSVLQQYWGR